MRAKALSSLQKMGTKTYIWLTDDPWNVAHYSKWMMHVLPHYDVVLTPRKSNFSQLQDLCGDKVYYLPFGYSVVKHLCRPTQETETDCDVLFVGGADKDRIPIVHSIIQAGFKVALYGGYWDRDPITRPFNRGIASVSELNEASQRAKVCLVLVRRANRDGHVMRTFEAAACGSCMLVEETNEHLAIFGVGERSPVKYFSSQKSMISEIYRLIANCDERNRLRFRVREWITETHHSYCNRLTQILSYRTDRD